MTNTNQSLVQVNDRLISSRWGKNKTKIKPEKSGTSRVRLVEMWTEEEGARGYGR